MEAADMAFETVKSMQLESGGFASMGTENCESTAQAIIAAACMGDAEWITDSGVLEALLDYRCESGFSHIYGGEANGLATSQACCALTAYLKLTADEEHAFSDTEEISEDTHETLEAAQGGITGGMLKLYIVALCAVSGLALLIIWLVGGRKKPLLCLAAVVFLVVGGVAAFVDFKSPEEYYSQGGVSEGIEVTVSVDCLEALGYPEKACDGLVIPRDGVIITERTVIVPEASTVMEALIEAAKADKITVDFVDSWSGVYIRGIAGLYEFDFGSESGWLYYVNGESPSCAASEYILQDGDRIRVCYTCTLGR